MTDAETSPEAASIDPGLGAVPAALPQIEGTAAAPTGTDALGRPWPPFAHGSEAEMARILDFYEVHWDYEPRTFPILWNLDGDVVESFSPDFYLPDLDLYLELTTLKQRLVRKKNRKLRRLRELYPDIRIKLFYARDFRAMMLKYGRLALADSLSGTLGQVMPERDREPDLALAVAVLEASAEPATRTARIDAVVPGGHTRPTPDRHAPVAATVPGPASPAPLPARPPAAGLGSDDSAVPTSRRNASRSRRRRAAAAARAAARGLAEATSPTTTGAEEERRPR